MTEGTAHGPNAKEPTTQFTSSRTVALSALVGRRVRGAEGRVIGRIEELSAEIELHPHGSSYVVTHVSIGRHGWLDRVLSGRFVPPLAQRWRRWTGYRRYEVPWHALDLGDLAAPRLRVREDQFTTGV